MKRWLLGIGLVFALTGSAQASVLDWPVISQGKDVVQCLAEDAGTIAVSFVTHATAFTVETFKTVGECLIYVTAKVTPLPDIVE